MNNSDCPRCHEAGAMLEERTLFPQTRQCDACNEHQRRCGGCGHWFAETDLTVIDHAPLCDVCVKVERDYDAFRAELQKEAERDRWELVRLAKNLTIAWRF